MESPDTGAPGRNICLGGAGGKVKSVRIYGPCRMAERREVPISTGIETSKYARACPPARGRGGAVIAAPPGFLRG
ncbi:MAG: hypothetical protein DRH32_08655 [Deltaproteobacteria bacterium]|nr:MAG: hypothetical protein DRH32_08655 [Deltaproteobacteria bacterium]